MAKAISRSKLVKQLDSVFSQYIRQKDSVNEITTCFTCGKKDHWKKLQNGHFQQFLFGQNLDIKYGAGTSRRLHIKAQGIIKINNAEIKEMINHYKNFVD